MVKVIVRMIVRIILTSEPLPDVVCREVATVGHRELSLSLQSNLQCGLVDDGSGPGHVETLRTELVEPAGGGDTPVVSASPPDVDEAGGGPDYSRSDVIVASPGPRGRRIWRILIPREPQSQLSSQGHHVTC